jgi:uncharacterized protein
MKRVAVAALSARALAQAAAREGFEVVALDVFGDADTRRAASQWCSIGAPEDDRGWRIGDGLLLDALGALARADRAQGWIVGAGFEARLDLIEEGGRRLPLIGNGVATLRRLHHARSFFEVLDAHGVAHPPVRFDGPGAASGWLLKDFAGSGGQQVRRAQGPLRHKLGATRYFQQERRGATPMSATFIADGRRACVLGCNRQLVRATRDRPFAWCGVIGPVAVSAGILAQVNAALHALVPEVGLRGLGSLDFLAFDGEDRIEVLEVNARVPASAQLYAAAGRSVIGAHVRACEHGVLPTATATATAPRGIATVFAPRDLQVGDAAARWLATQPGVHDIPAQAMRFRADDPVCSVGAVGDDAAAVQQQLLRRMQSLLAALETYE